MKKTLVSVCVAVGLAACGSSVKLNNNVPVEDKTGAPVAPAEPDNRDAMNNGNAVATSQVTPVELKKTSPEDAIKAMVRVVYFDFDSYVIRPEFQGVIETHAKFLKANPSRKLSLEGHTDERGGREYNLALGQKRAEAVKKALLLLGVAEGQLEAVSFGKEKPAVLGSSEDAMTKNRRVELSYR